MGRVLVGISGWNYPSWRGAFYPKGLPRQAELAYAASQFCSVEVNASFYRLQKPETYLRWSGQTPPDFVFAVKGSRYITHIKRLHSDVAVANFLASGVLALGDKLGPLLWQLPASTSFDEDVLRQFVSRLPRSTAEAAVLAAAHDDRLKDRTWLAVARSTPLRHAIEVRHESFRDERFYAVLREHNVALVVADSAGHFPQLEADTADFSYVRLHGAEELYASGYDDETLRKWSERIVAWNAPGHDVFVYFDNDSLGHAPFDAQRLAAMLPSPARD